MSDFTVDLQDPESVEKALALAQNRMETAQTRHVAAVEDLERATAREKEATAEVERWRALAFTLQQAGQIMAAASAANELDDAEQSSPELEMNSKALALQVITALNGATNIAEVAEHMPQFARKTVSWALWKLAEERAVVSLGNGRYAPLGYQPGVPTTNYLNLPPGFPAPPARPGTAILDAMARAKAEREP
jgi:hypothetical protein